MPSLRHALHKCIPCGNHSNRLQQRFINGNGIQIAILRLFRAAENTNQPDSILHEESGHKTVTGFAGITGFQADGIGQVGFQRLVQQVVGIFRPGSSTVYWVWLVQFRIMEFAKTF